MNRDHTEKRKGYEIMESRRNRTVIITVIGGIGFTNTMLGGLAAEARLLEAL